MGFNAPERMMFRLNFKRIEDVIQEGEMRQECQNKLKCGKCSAIMKEKEDTLFGEKVKTYVCSRCGNKMIPLKEAIRVQQKIIPKIETTRKLVQFGGSIAVTLP